jgi:hypothetical protein
MIRIVAITLHDSASPYYGADRIRGDLWSLPRIAALCSAPGTGGLGYGNTFRRADHSLCIQDAMVPSEPAISK